MKHGYIPGKNRDLKVVKKNILDSKPTANKKCDLINIPKKTADTTSVVRLRGMLVWLGLLLLKVLFRPGHRECCLNCGQTGLSVNNYKYYLQEPPQS